MKLQLGENKIRASLEDEGRDLVLEIALCLRHEEGKILPVLAFGKTPEGAGPAAASIQRRVTRLLGPVHVAPWGKRPIPIESGRERDAQDGEARTLSRVRSLPRLPRL